MNTVKFNLGGVPWTLEYLPSQDDAESDGKFTLGWFRSGSCRITFSKHVSVEQFGSTLLHELIHWTLGASEWPTEELNEQIACLVERGLWDALTSLGLISMHRLRTIYATLFEETL